MLKIKRLLLAITIAAVLPINTVFAESFATSAVTSEVMSDEYDVLTGRQIFESIEEFQEFQEFIDEDGIIDMVDDSLVRVIVPSNLDFITDPLEVANRGQIYSENNFEIQNCSRFDAIVRLKDIKYTFTNDTDFLSLQAPPAIPFGLENPSELKEVYMVLNYVNRDMADIVITTDAKSEEQEIFLAAAEYDDDGRFVALREDSSIAFTFSGMVNHMPAVEWADKDFEVSISYEIIPLYSDEEDLENEVAEALEPTVQDRAENTLEEEDSNRTDTQEEETSTLADVQEEEAPTQSEDSLENTVSSESEDSLENISEAVSQPDDSGEINNDSPDEE